LQNPQTSAADEHEFRRQQRLKLGVALGRFIPSDFRNLYQWWTVLAPVILNQIFHKAGPELKDSLLGIITCRIEKIKQMVKQQSHHRFILLAGGKTMGPWIKGFQIAKQLNVHM
jgi:hypothetical protein